MKYFLLLILISIPTLRANAQYDDSSGSGTIELDTNSYIKKDSSATARQETRLLLIPQKLSTLHMDMRMP